jgi:hypothetical protein
MKILIINPSDKYSSIIRLLIHYFTFNRRNKTFENACKYLFRELSYYQIMCLRLYFIFKFNVVDKINHLISIIVLY